MSCSTGKGSCLTGLTCATVTGRPAARGLHTRRTFDTSSISHPFRINNLGILWGPLLTDKHSDAGSDATPTRSTSATHDQLNASRYRQNAAVHVQTPSFAIIWSLQTVEAPGTRMAE
ncbi:uncharacterized protein TRAVEDRAFT_26780 [Trametes versicolor FP-101664 SS1]|uniref:uncharacterized protein n=1 Tax=Trametes versicolor (strain FP-101664) TaxID=717944 RepID=UPI0004621E15|nr:uncharacterized protein TRAVEDRAFT_26780 [Trametes versicolor FP-101664 SS1]EIW63554.1 hypothetical protein TRAVEDRAFT_26780 [Trametes versicolor FP-101664 SS1]